MLAVFLILGLLATLIFLHTQRRAFFSAALLSRSAGNSIPRALCGGVMAAVKGKGAKLWLWDSTIVTPALVQIGELVSVTPPQRTRDTVDTTHHGSTGDYREFVSNLIDAGEVSFTINYVPGGATETLLNDAFADGDVRTFAIDVNTPTPGTQRRISGSAILTGFEPDEIGIEDKMSASMTLKVSGPITFGAAP